MGEPASPARSGSSEASSLSLVSRDLFETKNRVRVLEQTVSTLQESVHFQEDKIANLEHQRASIESALQGLQTSHEGLAQQVLALEAELQAARNSIAYRSAEAVTHDISIARIGRRVAEVERRLQLHLCPTCQVGLLYLRALPLR